MEWMIRRGEWFLPELEKNQANWLDAGNSKKRTESLVRRLASRMPLAFSTLV
jgi:hypothetical protein